MTRKIIPCIACLASASLQDPDDFIRGARARPQISLAPRQSRVPGPGSQVPFGCTESGVPRRRQGQKFRAAGNFFLITGKNEGYVYPLN